MDSSPPPPAPIVSQYVLVTALVPQKKKRAAKVDVGEKKVKVVFEPDDDQNAVYVFYSKSAEKLQPLPGCGQAESILNPNYPCVKELSEYRGDFGYGTPSGFRRALSNFSRCCDFTYKGHTYRTVEHAFHGVKLRMCAEMETDPTKKQMFLTNAQRLAVGEHPNPVVEPVQAKTLGGKQNSPMDQAQRDAWGEAGDPSDPSESIKPKSMRDGEMAAIHMARAQSCFENPNCGRFARCVLLTKDAKLIHDMGRGRGYEHFLGLEAWRGMMWGMYEDSVKDFLGS